MKKINTFWNNHKKELLALAVITVLYIIIFCCITKNKYLFISTTDYETQHYLLPEYFRNLFYETKNIFPDIAWNLGGGQNIYYLSYYGLLNPIILLSYFFPNIAMIDYLPIAMSLIVVLSSFFVYLLVRKNNYKHTTSLITAILFLLASPIIYHAHRHIMFISYFPFLLLGLFGVDTYIKKKRSTLLTVSICLMILTSYYFSVAGLVVIVLYFLYKQMLQDPEISLKALIKRTLTLIKPLIFGILLGMVIILPTAYCLLNGRNSNNTVSIWNLLIPNPAYMYTAYSPGLTIIEFILLLAPLLLKKVPKAVKCLSLILLFMFIFPIVNYLLNGTLYINAKTLIPFLPLVMLILAWSLEQITHHKKLLTAFLLIMTFVICLIVNSTDTLMKKELKNSDIEKSYRKLVTKIHKNDTSIYRIGNLTSNKNSLNKVYTIEELKSSIYSSTQNKNYQKFYLDVAESNQKYRNNMMISTSDSLLTQALMGEKYIITEKTLTNGYHFIAQEGKLKLYENTLALPLAYTIEKEADEEAEYPYNLLNIFTNASISQNSLQTTTTSILTRKNLEYKRDHNTIQITAKKDASIKLQLNDSAKDQLVFITFKNKHNASCSPKKKDQKISINEVENKLTCKQWKYHNQNNTFHYVLVSPKDLTITLTPGTYQLTDIKIQYFPLEKLTTSHISPVKINKIENNKLQATINSKKQKDVIVSLPYDDGFKVTIDNQNTPYTKTTNNFIKFLLPAGSHNITISYQAPYKKLGLVLSILGIILTVGDAIFNKYNKTVRK